MAINRDRGGERCKVIEAYKMNHASPWLLNLESAFSKLLIYLWQGCVFRSVFSWYMFTLHVSYRKISCIISCFEEALYQWTGEMRCCMGEDGYGTVPIDAEQVTTTPRFIGRPYVDRVLPSNFLEGEWNLDILSPDGFTK